MNLHHHCQIWQYIAADWKTKALTIDNYSNESTASGIDDGQFNSTR